MRKNILLLVLIVSIICMNLFAVFADELCVADIITVSDSNFEYLRVEKINETGTKEVLECKDATLIEKVFDSLCDLTVSKTQESEEYFYCGFVAGDNRCIYNSNDGFEIKTIIETNKFEYFVNKDDVLNILKLLGITKWHSLPVVEPMKPSDIEPIKNDNSNIDKNFEIKALNQNGIIVGDPDGDLRAEDGVTRAEFAAVLCRAMGCEIEAQEDKMKQKKYFPDVSSEHWAIGYINFAYESGAISGFPDGNFYPEQSVTNEQVIKMLIAAWGYGEEAEQNGGYPNGYMKIAKDHGVLDTVSFNYANASKRWIASVFVYGVLSIQPENDKIKLPVKTELISIDVPREENNSYVERPEEILRKVSKESSFYERTVFEQQVPEKNSPIKIDGKSISNTWYRAFSIGINKDNATGKGYSKELQIGEKIDLSDFENGKYSISVGYNDGEIDDFSFGSIIISDSGISQEALLHRYTNLQNVIKFEEETEEIELSNSKATGNIPFEIKSTSDGNGKFVLCINYSGSLKDDEEVRYAINDMDLNFSADDRFIAPMNKVEPIIISGLNVSKEYNLQISFLSKNCNKTLKGILILSNEDYILKGNYTITNMK